MTMKTFANMAPRYETVILCRGVSEKSDSQETYVETLKTGGYLCNCLPTLKFDFVNISRLKTCLLSRSSYYGLILTSRRAVEAIDLASEENDDILPAWRTLPVYCVGPATMSVAKSHLGLENCFGKDTGNAKELAELIVGTVARDSNTFLYPCSEIGKETVEKTLNENGIKVHRIVVYRTLPSETLEQDLSELMDNVPKIFVFFSPSTVEYIVQLFKEKLYDLRNVKAVAIGPVTRQALIDIGMEVFATATKPDPMSLLEAISNAEKNEVTEKTE